MNERTLTMLGQWAKNANTNIPAPPVPGQAYRNTELDAATIEVGQRYSTIADSAEWNQLRYISTGLLQQLEQFGMLPYSSLTNYPVYGKALGLEDGVAYEAIKPSGPDQGGAKPVTDTEYWKKLSFGGGGTHVGAFEWCLATTPPAGWLNLSLDNGLLPRATFPELWEYALGSGNLLDDVTWQAERTANGVCGRFSTGNGIDTFRVPHLREVFIRAPGGATAVGQFQKDAQQNITASHTGQSANVSVGVGGAAYKPGSVYDQLQAGSTNMYGVSFDASRQIRTATEVRPVNITYMPIIKAFDEAINQSTVDMAALVQALVGKVDRADWTQSHTGNGWQRLPSGLIVQWGTGLTGTDGLYTATYPVAFPNAALCLNAISLASALSTVGTGAVIISSGSSIAAQKTSITYAIKSVPAGGAQINQLTAWLAIGY